MCRKNWKRGLRNEEEEKEIYEKEESKRIRQTERTKREGRRKLGGRGEKGRGG